MLDVSSLAAALILVLITTLVAVSLASRLSSPPAPKRSQKLGDPEMFEEMTDSTDQIAMFFMFFSSVFDSFCMFLCIFCFWEET